MEGPGEGERTSRLPRWAWTGLGHLAVGLGALGIVVPGLPTTPFILVAASCYARGSARFHGWLLGHRLFGPMVCNWQENRAISLGTKVFAIVVLWVVLGSTILLFAPYLWVKLVLAAIGLGVTAFLLTVKTRAAAPVHQPQDSTRSTPAPEIDSSR